MKKYVFILVFALAGLPALKAQITNGSVNYEMRIDQWYQGYDNDSFSSDDNEVRTALSSDPNSGGTQTWTTGGQSCAAGSNAYAKRWQADAPSYTGGGTANFLMYYCSGRANTGNYFYCYKNSWEADSDVGCRSSGGDGSTANTSQIYFKSATKTPCRWWGVTEGSTSGTADASTWAIASTNGNYQAKTIWRYYYGYDCSNPLTFGTLSNGTTYTNANSNRNITNATTGTSGAMSYANVRDNAAPDVFYSFTLSSPAVVNINTQTGTNYDSYLRLFTGGCGTLITYDDDGGGSSTSLITRALCAGTYIVMVEGFSTNSGDFTLSITPTALATLSGGTIAGITGGVTICTGGDPGAFTNTADASGGFSLAAYSYGSTSYQWESSTTSASSGFADIGGQTGGTYDPGTLSSTTWFRRRTTDACGTIAYSNVIQVVVAAQPMGTTPSYTNGTICTDGSTNVSTTASGGAGTYSYQWQYYNGSTWNNVGTGTPAGFTYTNPTSATMTIACSNAAVGSYQYRCFITSSGVGCSTGSYTGGASFTVVAQPTGTTPAFTNATVCTDGTTAVSTTASGGTGTYSYQWQYYNGSTWNNVSTGTPSGFTYTNPTAASMTIACSGAAPGSYQYRCFVTSSGSGCSTGNYTAGTSFTVVAQPTGSTPVFTNTTVCTNGSTAVSTTASGGTGTYSYQWQYYNGSTWNNVGTGTPSGFTYTNPTTANMTIACSGAAAGSYQYRCFVTSSGSGCSTGSYTGGTSFTVVAQPTGSTPVFTNTAICDNGSTAVSTTASGGTGAYAYQWQYFNGSTWNNVGTGTPTGFTYTNAATATMTISCSGAVASSYQYRCFVSSSGSGCGTGSYTAGASFNVTGQPSGTTPVYTNASICTNGSTAVSTTAGGGTGTYSYQWQYFNGSTWNNVGTGTPTGFTYTNPTTATMTIACSGAAAGSYPYRCFVTSSGSGCSTGSYTGGTSFTVLAQPTGSTPSFTNTSVCTNGSTAVSTTASGGTGTYSYQWQYYNGSTWNNVGTGTPTGFTYTNATTAAMTIACSNAAAGSYQYRCFVTSSGSGCSTGSYTGGTSFTVVAQPTGTTPSFTNTSICGSGNTAVSTTAGGGIGTYSYQWQYYNGSTWNNVGTGTPTGFTYTNPTTATMTISCSGSPTGFYQYRCSVMSSGSGCSAGSYTAGSTLTVASGPSWASNTLSPTGLCIGGAVTFSATVSGGLGGTVSWVRATTPGGAGTSVTSPDTPPSATTYYYRPQYAASGVGCNLSDGTERTVTVNPLPTAFTPTLVTATPLCFRGNASIQVAGSQSGVGYRLRDNTTNVGASQSGTGGTLSFLTDNLTANSSTYNVLASTGAGCTLSVAVPTIAVTSAPSALASNGDVRTCYVNGNNAFVEFISSNGSILAINPGTQNLGNVTVTEYVNGSPINIQACGTSPTSQPQFNAASLGRHWTISSTVAPTANLNVRLYFANGDITALSAASLANTDGFDDLSDISGLQLSKYSGTNENGTFTDNCGNGTVTLHPQIANGVMNSGSIGYSVGSSGYSVHTVSSFSEFWLAGTGNISPLPIELTSFTATCQNGMVQLDWTTASEINNQKFIIERSGDLQAWEEVAVLPGAGNSNAPLSYNTVDTRPLQGLGYYRLTQKDFDGASETFTPVSITCYTDGNGNSLMVYPNPATDNYTVSIVTTEAASGELEVTDMNGKRVTLRHVNLVQGTNSFTMEATTLNPGTYVIYIRSSNLELKPVKLVVKK